MNVVGVREQRVTTYATSTRLARHGLNSVMNSEDLILSWYRSRRQSESEETRKKQPHDCDSANPIDSADDGARSFSSSCFPSYFIAQAPESPHWLTDKGSDTSETSYNN